MLRRQFAQLMTDLRAELERASEPALAVADGPTLRQKINRTYETLYADYDWPHLMRTFDAIPLQTGQRYYDPPEDMDFDRMEEVVCWNNNLPIPIERGIMLQDYAVYNSETGGESDPAVKWDVRYDEPGNKEVIEIWPIPASNANTVQFRGIQKFARLVNDEDRCRLDDQMVILYTAAELTPAKSGNKQLLLSAAKERYLRVRGRGKAGAGRVRIGLGDVPKAPTRSIVRISG